jgi:chromate transporter
VLAVFLKLGFSSFAAVGFLLLIRWKLPPLAVVAMCAAAGVMQFAVR